MYDIITLGSANVDIFVKTKIKPEINKHLDHYDIAYHLGDKLLVDDLHITTGGGGTNTAVAFSRLGLKTGFIGSIGKDVNGSLILNELKKEKVTFLGKVKEGNTGLSVILPGSHDRTILAYKGVNNNLSIKDLKLDRIKSKWLYVSSMLGQSFETAESLIFLAKKRKTKIALNLSAYVASLGLDKLSQLLSSADVIILNKDEAKLLTGEKDLDKILNKIYEHTYGKVVITSGSGHIIASDSLRVFTKQIHPINPIDKTGAGDAFAAGFVYSMMKELSIQQAMDNGHKEALSVLSAIGAKNNLLKKL